MSLMRRFFTAPWLVFLVLGALVYVLIPREQEKPLIHISRSQIEGYLEAYLKQFPLPYSDELEQRLLQQLIAEEALLQQALAMDYQYLPIVQDRLKKLGSFLQEEEEQPTDQQLVDRAIDLGLLQSDPVIRRYLVSVMERALVASVPMDITDEEINDYYQQHIDDFVRPSRVDISHVFFSEDQGRTAEYAAHARERLVEKDMDRERDAVLGEGDVFYSGHQFAGKSETQLASLFGVEFAHNAFQQPVRQWSVPLRSAYGWHLVWLDQIRPPVTPPLAQVEDKVIARIRQDKEKDLLKQQIERLQEHYDIVIEDSVIAGAAT